MASTTAVTARGAGLCLGGSLHTAAVVQGCGKIVECLKFLHCCCFPGITALEMAEGKPPYGDIHPMRVGSSSFLLFIMCVGVGSIL